MTTKKNAHPHKNAELGATDAGRNPTSTIALTGADMPRVDSRMLAQHMDEGTTHKPMTPRQERVLQALQASDGWIVREAIDRISGASNGPEVIRQLRCRFGYDAIEMERINTVDRDGLPTQPGRYRLTNIGREFLEEKGGA